MITFAIRAAGQTRQGPGSALAGDRFTVDDDSNIFVVADGGGRWDDEEDRAAPLAIDVLPRCIRAALDDHRQPARAIQEAMAEAQRAVLSLTVQEFGHGASVAMAFRWADQIFLTWLGDCRAYLIADGKALALTENHTIAHALARAGTISAEEARTSPWNNVLMRYLGSPEPAEPFEVTSYTPRPGCRLILATDGLWRHAEDSFARICREHPHPQDCAAALIQAAAERGARGDFTCIVLAFDPVRIDPSWLSWNDGAAAKLAQVIHAERHFHHLPILADALEDAGCADADILEHLRSPRSAHAPCEPPH